MKTIFKRFFGLVFLKSGLFYIFRFLNRNKLRILAFHNPNFEEFENQIKFIKKYFTPINLRDVYGYYYKGKNLPKYSLLITFDDGYKNIKTFVEPILNKHKVNAVVFLPTGLIDLDSISWWDIVEYALSNTKKKHIMINERKYEINKEKLKDLIKIFYHLLTNCEEEEKQNIIENILKQTEVNPPKKIPEKYQFLKWVYIKNSKLEYGSHTVTHPILINLNKEDIGKELNSSKKRLESELKKPIIAFCYPNGDYNGIAVKEAESAGYKLGFSTRHGSCNKNTNPFLLKRIGINKLDDVGILSMKICGLFTPIGIFREYRKKIKVIIATNYYYPQLGGITTSVDNLNKKLIENGLDSKIYEFPNNCRRIEALIKSDIIKKYVHKLLVIAYVLKGLLVVLKDRILLRKVVVHGHSANFCALFAYISTFLGAKSVFTFHTDIRLEGYKVIERDRAKNIFFLNKINRLTAVSEFLKNQATYYYNLRTSIKVVYNGISKDFSNNAGKLRRDKNSILFVGNLNEIKDPFTFVKAVKILKDKNIKVNAKIIGTGEFENNVKSMINELKLDDYCSIIGNVSHEDISKYYFESSLYVCSSVGEGLSNTIIEAVACGCRVVATSVGGIPEIGIEKYGCGKLVLPKNAVLMAKAIKSELGKKTSKYTSKLLEKFNLETNTRQYIHIYKDLFNKQIKEAHYAELIK